MPKHNSKKLSSTPAPGSITSSSSLASLKLNPRLNYKLLVLLHDLRHIKDNPAFVARIDRTTDELYNSTPYFPPDETQQVKNSIVVFGRQDVAGKRVEEWGDEFEDISNPTSQDNKTEDGMADQKEITVAEAIHSHLTRFLEKRKASGDARPCGPHTLAPIYQAAFQVEKKDLEDEKFLSRLKRVGLDFGESSQANGGGSGQNGSGSKKEKEKGGKKGGREEGKEMKWNEIKQCFKS